VNSGTSPTEFGAYDDLLAEAEVVSPARVPMAGRAGPRAAALRAAPAEMAGAPAQPPAAAGMTMRSWYMPKESADQLATLVNDIHFAARLPKHLIMGAAVNVLRRHRGEIEAEARSAAANG
jgi:hypothetical protein